MVKEYQAKYEALLDLLDASRDLLTLARGDGVRLMFTSGIRFPSGSALQAKIQASVSKCQ